MKKLLYCFTIICFLFSGCSKNMDDVMNKPNFAGIVTEVYDKSILVSVNEEEDEMQSSDKISVSLDVEMEDSLATFHVGDEVRIYYDGSIAESYPAQVNKVYKIVLVNEINLDDQAIYPNENFYETKFYVRQGIYDNQGDDRIVHVKYDTGYAPFYKENEAEEKEDMASDSLSKDTDVEDFSELGISIYLPENEKWIIEPIYSIVDETIAQVQYYDGIAKTDVVLRVGKEDIQKLFDVKFSADESRDESYFARTAEGGEYVDIKIQHGTTKDEKQGVLVSWNHKDRNYVLWADFEETIDTSPIAKTACYIAEQME